MALDKNNLVQLLKVAMKADPSTPATYSFNGQSLSYEALNETARQELNALAATHAMYRENKNLIFSIIEEVMDDILPKKVAQQYADFAEVKTFAQGDKPEFKRARNSNRRAKQFITRVGLAGRYECFKLSKGQETFQVPTSAVGGAAQIGFEEFLDGRVDLGELLNIVLEGIDDVIFKEIGAALNGAINQLPEANRVSVDGFDEAAMDRLITIAAAYGTPVVYCTREFAVRMVPQEAWRYTEAMKDELWKTGRLANYKGTKVVILEQGFVDETHTTKVIDPGYAWVIPTGADGKPVKVAMEGATLVDEWKNRDWSKEIQVYKKVGVVAMMNNSICVYVDTSLLGQMDATKTSILDTVKNTVYTAAL